jgi:hypothetical protein
VSENTGHRTARAENDDPLPFVNRPAQLSGRAIESGGWSPREAKGALDAFAYADARTRRDLARVDRLRAHFNAVFTSQILSFYLGRPLTF